MMSVVHVVKGIEREWEESVNQWGTVNIFVSYKEHGVWLTGSIFPTDQSLAFMLQLAVGWVGAPLVPVYVHSSAFLTLSYFFYISLFFLYLRF